jgi:hypothetical protein
MANVGLTPDFGGISHQILGLQIVHEFQYKCQYEHGWQPRWQRPSVSYMTTHDEKNHDDNTGKKVRGQHKYKTKVPEITTLDDDPYVNTSRATLSFINWHYHLTISNYVILSCRPILSSDVIQYWYVNLILSSGTFVILTFNKSSSANVKNYR